MTPLDTQLLVIGGGATGLGVAWDAALRGIHVVLVEKGDIGQGTSGRYHGLLHSGGRYVISDPDSARDCAAENRILRRLVPHAVEDTGGLFVATPSDPEDYADSWQAACRKTGVEFQELALSAALRDEPLLSPSLRRAFAVRDAALDSFDLLHALVYAIRNQGGTVLLRHPLEALQPTSGGRLKATIRSLRDAESRTVTADVAINAAGPWAGAVARSAGVDLPLALGKGSMLAMAARPMHTIVNRLKPPADGDILVPVGTVAVLGTTDVPVTSPENLEIESWEIDLLLAEAEALVPAISRRRPLRAWAGIRPLYRPARSSPDDTRHLPRAHVILDHGAEGALPGFFSVIGGKLTTFRLMAEQTLDLVAPAMGCSAPCRTASVPLEPALPRRHYTLPSRLSELEQRAPTDRPPHIVCECETVTRDQIVDALHATDTLELDDIRRDLRLGMGPCQGGFCAYRAAGIATSTTPDRPAWLQPFLDERWRGLRPVAWGANLRQIEFLRRIYLDLVGAQPRDAPENP